MELGLPVIPEEVIGLAVVVWIFLGLVKPLLYRVVDRVLVGEALPLLSVVLVTLLSRGVVTDVWTTAVVYGVVGAVLAAGAHDIWEQYVTRG